MLILLLILGLFLTVCCGCSANDENNLSLSTFISHRNFEIDTIELLGNKYSILNPYHEKYNLHLKGSMHNHTDYSSPVDGYGSGNPYFVANKFRDYGQFDFYCFTDHNYVTPGTNIEDIIWMGKAVEDTQHHHLLVYNLPDDYNYQFVSDDINEQIRYYHSIGAFVSYGHPDWSGSYQSTDKIAKVEDIDFVEVFNTIEGGSERAFNILMQKNVVMAFGTDDYHYNNLWDNPDQYFNKSYIIVNTNKREKNSIWNSILKGNFYATTGAKMDISLENSSIIIKCDTVSEIIINSPDPSKLGKSIIRKKFHEATVVKYNITGLENILWIKVLNSNGSAISQPFYISKL